MSEKRTKWTEGPWEAVPQTNGSRLIVHCLEVNGLRVVGQVYSKLESATEDKANARLIAAAPELVEALRECVKVMDQKCWHLSADKARELLQRIQGEEVAA